MSAKSPSSLPKHVSFVPAVPFDRLMATALEGMVRSVLETIRDAQVGFRDDGPDAESTRSLVIRFRVDHERVQLPLLMRKIANESGAEYMDIVLDAYFRDLKPGVHDFSVKLMYGDRNIWMTLTVPYAAIRQIQLGDNILNLTPHHTDRQPEEDDSGKQEKGESA